MCSNFNMYGSRYILRLCRKDAKLKYNHIATSTAENIQNDQKNKQNKKFELAYEKYKDKIMFNSYLERDKLELGYYRYYLKTIKNLKKTSRIEYQNKCLEPLPISLKYVVDEDRLLTHENTETEQPEPEKIFQLPLGSTSQITISDDNNDTQQRTKIQQTSDTQDSPNINKWMTAYEHFDDSRLKSNEHEEELDYEWCKQYGTPDPSSKVSRVPCGGCGALLHCSDTAIPGYIPSEVFIGRTIDELLNIECQRCHFLKEYNIALDVSVQPEEYERLLQSIGKVKSLVVMMVDLLDFPCSIWPGIVDIIGTDRPIFIVGNKVDLLPGDSIGYLKRVKESLITEIQKTKLNEANIKYVSLISAKTGYGVEDLISAMFKLWLYKGHVFLVGCTNVGKSSLFNALLQSDYCKVQAVDIIQRATVSRWPGTTLNLLKFPINRPSGWKIYQRTQRLQTESQLLKYEEEIRKSQIKGTTFTAIPSIMGRIGRTFSVDPRESGDVFGGADRNKSLGLNVNDRAFATSKWFYDTPGVVHPDQVLSLLTTEELLMTIPKQLIRPQTYYLHKGTTIFVGGLARVDFVDCTEACRFTVFCSDGLPITIAKTEDADRLYEEFLGTDLFGVPSGGAERLNNWPGLRMRPDVLEFIGDGPKLCCGDIVLSSVAWMAVTAKKGSACKVHAWTPQGRGIHARKPSVLVYTVNLKGDRIRDTPAYQIGKVFVDE